MWHDYEEQSLRTSQHREAVCLREYRKPRTWKERLQVARNLVRKWLCRMDGAWSQRHKEVLLARSDQAGAMLTQPVQKVKYQFGPDLSTTLVRCITAASLNLTLHITHQDDLSRGTSPISMSLS